MSQLILNSYPGDTRIYIYTGRVAPHNGFDSRFSFALFAVVTKSVVINRLDVTFLQICQLFYFVAAEASGVKILTIRNPRLLILYLVLLRIKIKNPDPKSLTLCVTDVTSCYLKACFL